MNLSAPIRAAAATLFSAFLCAAQSPVAGMPASTASRILEQATWGPTPASVQALQSAGFDNWFASQVAAPVSAYPNQPPYNLSGTNNYSVAPTQVQMLQYALNNSDQLRQRVAFALCEIWVVSRDSNVVLASAFPPYLNVCQQDAFASYAQLIHDMTLNPAMGDYLNMVNNRAAANGALPNENYGRELMQLFTLGLYVLNPDGTQVMGSNNMPLASYPQSTVADISRALTGWTYGGKVVFSPTSSLPDFTIPMIPIENSKGVETAHDEGSKSLQFVYPDGTTHTTVIPANQTAEMDLTDTINALMANPSMAPFVSQQLIQHLVTGNPSGQYVSRVSAVFSSTGGNLQKVIYAILTDPEARAGDTSGGDPASFGHLREPMLWLTSLLRGMNGAVATGAASNNYLSNLGQNLLNAPSVFSYFSPDYRAGSILAPEFQIYDVQAALNRANYTYSIVYGGKLDAGTTFDISAFTTAAGTSNAALITAIGNQFFHGQMSSTLQTNIASGLAGQTTAAGKAQAALYIALTSSEFQIIH